MKKIVIFMPFLILLMVTSCEKDPLIRFGFDTAFDRDSQGTSIMDAGNRSQMIAMTGDIMVTEGTVLVELIDPAGEIVFTRHFTSPGNYSVDESFQAAPGYWKLKYKSIEGAGTLTLDLTLVY